MNKIIKVVTYQEKAVFRTPYSMEVIETYPLLPYSTILGFIHNMLSSTETIYGINISVQGKYKNLNREFVRYHKYETNKKEGKSYPIIITSLIDLQLIVHIKMPSEDLHNKLLFCLDNPPYFPYIGRTEDLIIDIEIKEEEEMEFDPSITQEGGLTLPYNCFIQFDTAKTLEVEGIPYFIPAYYSFVSKRKGKRNKIQEIYRNFEVVKVMYVQAGQTITKQIIIDREKIPIWWMK